MTAWSRAAGRRGWLSARAPRASASATIDTTNHLIGFRILLERSSSVGSETERGVTATRQLEDRHQGGDAQERRADDRGDVADCPHPANLLLFLGRDHDDVAWLDGTDVREARD